MTFEDVVKAFIGQRNRHDEYLREIFDLLGYSGAAEQDIQALLPLELSWLWEAGRAIKAQRKV